MSATQTVPRSTTTTPSSSSKTSAFPLTTPWVQPDICTDPGYQGSYTTVSTSGHITTEYGIRRSLALGCYPPFWISASSTYSPGMCPSGWQTARSTTSGSVTSGHCCPTGGWKAQDSGCIKVVTHEPQAVASFVTGSKVVATTLSDYTISGFGVHVAYQKADLSVFPSDYTPGVVYSAAAISSSTASTSTDASDGDHRRMSMSASKLGTGAIVAIVLCSIAFVLGVVLAIWLVMRSRRKRRDAEYATAGSETDGKSPSTQPSKTASPSYTTTPQPVEIGGSKETYELDGTQVAELPGSGELPHSAEAPRSAEVPHSPDVSDSADVPHSAEAHHSGEHLADNAHPSPVSDSDDLYSSPRDRLREK